MILYAVDEHQCQKALNLVKDNYENVRIQHLIGIGAEYVIAGDAKVKAVDNLATDKHPSWSHVSVYDAPSRGPRTDEYLVCENGYELFKPEKVKEGVRYVDGSSRGGDSPLSGTNQYITIVNFTPYRFKFDKNGPIPYQIGPFDFDDIPSGHSRQCLIHYQIAGNEKDSNAWAFYDVEGTNRGFSIHATTHISSPGAEIYPYRTWVNLSDWGMGAREFEDPKPGVPVTFIIVGSEERGYYTTLTKAPEGWMRAIYDTIKDRKLKHIVMPGTHDAGMSQIGPAKIAGKRSQSHTCFQPLVSNCHPQKHLRATGTFRTRQCPSTISFGWARDILTCASCRAAVNASRQRKNFGQLMSTMKRQSFPFSLEHWAKASVLSSKT